MCGGWWTARVAWSSKAPHQRPEGASVSDRYPKGRDPRGLGSAKPNRARPARATPNRGCPWVRLATSSRTKPRRTSPIRTARAAPSRTRRTASAWAQEGRESYRELEAEDWRLRQCRSPITSRLQPAAVHGVSGPKRVTGRARHSALPRLAVAARHTSTTHLRRARRWLMIAVLERIRLKRGRLARKHRRHTTRCRTARPRARSRPERTPRNTPIVSPDADRGLGGTVATADRRVHRSFRGLLRGRLRRVR